MSDILIAWREAVSAGCRSISEDEACSGYFRIPADQKYLTNQGTTDPDRAWLPVALWQDAETGRLVGLMDGETVNPSVIWPICRQYPIPYEAYQRVAELGLDWPDAFDRGSVTERLAQDGSKPSTETQSVDIQTAADTDKSVKNTSENGWPLSAIITSGANSRKINAPQDGRVSSATDKSGMRFPEPERMGHNQQSVGKHEVLAEMLADLLEEAEAWLAGVDAIDNQNTANQAGQFAERFGSLEKEAEEARTVEKRPVLEQGRMIDGKWKPIVTGATDGKKRMKRAVEPFLIAERLRIEAEAQEAGILSSTLSSPRAGIYGRKVGLRAAYVMQVNDEAQLIDAFRNDPRLWRDNDVRAVIKRLAEADLQAGREVAGVELVQELTAA
ncbi:MAG: hypothetical protein EB015_09690 [Methylocystaceae bacterium]|nr:hypothetical protein [Methylocystaceae bacterium]